MPECSERMESSAAVPVQPRPRRKWAQKKENQQEGKVYERVTVGP